MKKIAYNGCHGGFSLSDKAIRRYAEIKGIRLYVEEEPKLGFKAYWTVPEAERGAVLRDKAFYAASLDERAASNKFWRDHTINGRDLSRTDPVLIQVIEELGDAANGACAALRVAEIADGAKYRIDEYDGYESVMTPDDYQWETA